MNSAAFVRKRRIHFGPKGELRKVAAPSERGHDAASATGTSGSRQVFATRVSPRVCVCSATVGSRPPPRLNGEAVSKRRGILVARRHLRRQTPGDLTHTSADPAAHASIADPAAQPPRVTSPAEALHGRYHKTATYANGNTNDYDYLVQTYCLRTGQRCFSAWTPPDSGGSSTFVFEDGRWVRADAYDTDCTTGDRTHVDITEQHPLPQLPQDPITLLTGHGHKTNGGACPFNADFDETLQRTGD